MVDREGVEKPGSLVVVTGGAGYVGSTLCRELLHAGYSVRVLDSLVYGGRSVVGLSNHPRFELVKGDVRDVTDINRALEGEVAAVIHLAAVVGDIPCQENRSRAIQTNYEATMLLAEKSKKKRVSRFVFASTCSNYGIADTRVPADEDRALNPVSLYAETKIDSERGLTALATSEFSPTIFRFATAYGISGRTRFDLLVNSFSYEALTNGVIVVYGAETWRPYIHVLDMSRILGIGLSAGMEKIGNQIFNAGFTSENYPKYQIAEIIAQIVPGTKVSSLEGVNDPRTYRVDFSKIENHLKFRPHKLVADGVREIVGAFGQGLLTDGDFEANSLQDRWK